MIGPVRWLSTFMVLALTSVTLRAQEPAPAPPPAQVKPAGYTYDRLLDSSCDKPCWSGCIDCSLLKDLHCPHELFVRVGAATTTGHGPLEDVLRTGIALELGIKNFCPDPWATGDWTAELGLDYIYNNADLPAGQPPVTIIDNPDPPPNQLVIETFRLRELHRLYVHLAGGHEWYWHHDACLITLGTDLGGRVGHANAKFLGPNALQGSDIPYGFFIGLNGGFFIPCGKKDVIIGGRLEWAHDWIDITGGTDDDLTELKWLFHIGCRY